MPAPAEAFRVFPNRGKDRFVVEVYPTLPTMRKSAFTRIRKENRHYEPGQFNAIFFPYSKGPIIGRILFSRTRLSPGIVAHELNHAALHWAALRGKDVAGAHEEDVTAVLQRLVDQFHLKFPLDSE